MPTTRYVQQRTPPPSLPPGAMDVLIRAQNRYLFNKARDDWWRLHIQWPITHCDVPTNRNILFLNKGA